jgi:2-oxoglutarate ferredoxin oxidoreductase subunit gamma
VPDDDRGTASVEREVLLTGIGGQGVQLAATTLGVAATAIALEVLVFGSYGGTMRGGYTAATIVVGDEPLQTPPEVDDAWAAIALHHDFWPEERDRLRPGGIVVVDSSVFRGEVGAPDSTVIAVPATQLAADAGFAQAGAMIALGAFAAATGIVTLESLTAAAHEVLPSYRAQHAEKNARALHAGWELVERPVVPAWTADLGSTR